MKYARGSIFRTILFNIYHNEFIFKTILLFVTCLNLAAYNILTAASRVHSKIEHSYYPTTVVFLAEIVKLIITLCIISWNCGGRIQRILKLFKTEVIHKPKEVLEMCVPATVYALQNNLVYFVLGNLEPTMYQVLSHFKIFTTAFFMRIILGYILIPIQWLALLILFCGVVIVEIDPTQINTVSNNNGYYQSIAAMVVISICAGFAGVHFEKQLKRSKTSFWIRNVEMYSWGIVTSSLGMLVSDGRHIIENGFFYGYTPYVWIVLVLQSAGGLYVSLVMKYLDNIYKTFATSAGIILTAAGSSLVFKTSLGLPFIFGSVLVVTAVYLFSKQSWNDKTIKNAQQGHKV